MKTIKQFLKEDDAGNVAGGTEIAGFPPDDPPVKPRVRKKKRKKKKEKKENDTYYER